MRTRFRLVIPAVAVGALLAFTPLTAHADTVTDSIPVAQAPRVIAATPDGSKVVVVTFASTVSVVDTATGVESTPVSFTGTAYNVVVSPDGATAIVPTTDGNLLFVDVVTGAVSAPVAVAGYAFDLAFSLDSSVAYVTTGTATVLVVDVATRTVTGTLSIGSEGYGIALAPDGASLFVTRLFIDVVVKLEIATNTVTETHPGGPLPTEVAVRNDGRLFVGSLIGTNLGAVDPVASTYTGISISGGAPVSAMQLSPDGTRLYIPRGFSSEVVIVDTATNTQSASLSTGVGTSGIAISADGTTAFVGDSSTSGVLVIAIDRPPVLAASAPAATVGAAYSFSTLSQGSPTPTFTVTGTLPAGLALDTTTGVIGGTPTTPGAYTFTIAATNVMGTVSRSYSVTVSAIAALPAAGPSPAPLAALAVGLLLLGLLVRRQFAQGTSGTR